MSRHFGLVLFVVLCLMDVAAADVNLVDARAKVVAATLPARLALAVCDSVSMPVHARKIVLGNARLLSVLRPNADTVLLLGQAAGTTSLRVWDQAGVERQIAVTVTGTDLPRLLETVQGLLQGTAGVQARLSDDHVVLEGLFADHSARERAAQIADTYPSAVINLVGKVGWEQTVLLDVRIVELHKLSWRDIGIRWQDDIAGPRAAAVATIAGNGRLRATDGITGVPASALATLPSRAGAASIYFGIASSLDSRLHLLEQQGMASLLAEPVLSCRSGGTAHFVSGGEIPLPVANGLGSTNVEYKEYGVILDVQPVVAGDDAIFAKIETELSQLDPTQAVLGVPALLKRRSVTEINLRAGETLVIAGLTTHSQANGSQGLPRLARGSRGGALFGERTRRDERTELAIFITAQVMQAQRGGPGIADAERLRRAEQLAQDAAND